MYAYDLRRIVYDQAGMAMLGPINRRVGGGKQGLHSATQGKIATEYESRCLKATVHSASQHRNENEPWAGPGRLPRLRHNPELLAILPDVRIRGTGSRPRSRTRRDRSPAGAG